MTISAVVPDIAFAGTSGSGTLGPFSLVKNGTPIVFYSNSEILVYRYDSVTDEFPTLLVEGTHYTLTGSPASGSITLISPSTGLLTAERLYVVRKQTLAQALDLSNGGNFPSSALERRLDVIEGKLQELNRDVKSAVRFAMFDTDEIPGTAPLARAIDRIAYISGTAANPILEFINVNDLGAGPSLTESQLADINIIVADLTGADTIGIVATAFDTIGVDALQDVAENIGDVELVAEAVANGSLTVTKDTYDALTAIPAASRSNDVVVYVAGRLAVGDGGEGFWRFSATSTATANGGTILAPDAGTGRWLRQYDGGINVKWFGAVANGISDCSNAIAAAISAAIVSGAKKVTFSGGTYLVQSAGAFNLGASTVNGFTFEGDGMAVTTIQFINSNTSIAASSNYLYTNDNDHLRVIFRGLRFEGDQTNKNSRFMYLTSAGTAQSIRFYECQWFYFEGFCLLEGTATASEMLFVGCKWSNMYGKSYRINNVQSVNHNFYGCDAETLFDDFFYILKGGMINVFGGSWIMGGDGITTGAILHLDDTSGTGIGFNNWTYNFYGVRTELKDDSKFLDGQGQGVVTLNNCNTEVITGTSGRTIYTLYHGLMMVVSGGHFDGKIYLQMVDASAFANVNRPATAILRDCKLGAQFEYERQNGNNIGGKGKVIFERIKPGGLTSAVSEPMDQCVGWDDGSNSFAISKRVAILRNPNRANGLPHNTTGFNLVLPLNSIVTAIRLYHPSQSGPSSQTYYLKNGDASVTHATYTFNISAAQSSQTAMYFLCDSDTARTFVFSADAGNDGAAYAGFMEIEYIA